MSGGGAGLVDEASGKEYAIVFARDIEKKIKK